MKLSDVEIKNLIKALGYKPQDGEKDIFLKTYSHHDNYTIQLDFGAKKIEYGIEIKLGDLTTSNFENSENFVVLECIDRLLVKGYPPHSLSLEHKWPMGRQEKGKLDILVFDSDKKAYLMIECKTWGSEFEKEKKKMLRDGGQLFSYFVQNKAAQYLCLYTSRLCNNQIEYANEIVKVEGQWRELNDQKEIFAHWNKNFKDNGIFDDWSSAYGIEIKALTRGRLKELTSDDSGRIFNQFAEILRHNVVSDKPNAFNKILNLFVCKIIDEDKNEDAEVAFQWLENDTYQSLQTRLNDLYKEGMKQFLDIEVTDYTDDQLDSKLYNISDPNIKKQIQQMFSHLRLQKNPEFAFKEVYNEPSFVDNAVVVKEVVELLQPYQFRYGHKQQFLGDFFELLLNTSIKQEAGQYFTPVPIAKFIVSSLPIKEFIYKRVQSNSNDILPVAIDYAAGSGHFLTEWMDEVQNIIESFDTSSLRPTVTKKFNGWKQSQFEWAKDYVYGIEADYRLVKTAKVSSFLNGDGEALIIRANGLDKFDKSKDYKSRLKEISKDDPRNNAQFDVLIANPPYSVSAFKNTVQCGEESFELFNKLTENSSEIECLFVERAKQLLTIGGWAGIILPSSILSNTGIYTATREILLKYFYIKAIVELGSNTFMATGTNTVIMFLERRANTDYKKIQIAIDNFFNKPKEATVFGIEKAFEKYVSAAYEDISIDNYISFINKTPDDMMKQAEIYKEYKLWFNELSEIKQLKSKKFFIEKTEEEKIKELNTLFYQKVFECEQEKILYFLLAYPQKTVLIKVGEKQAEKDFLGYEFSNRRGAEGIKIYRDSNGKPTTKLYDEDNPLNSYKANSYVYNAFLNKKLDVVKELNQNIFIVETVDLFDFSKLVFEKTISMNSKKKVEIISKWDLFQLGEVAKVKGGKRVPKGMRLTNSITKYPYIRVADFEDGSVNLETIQYATEDIYNAIKSYTISSSDVYISIAGSIGLVGMVPSELNNSLLTENAAKIICGEKVNAKYLMHILSSNSVQMQIKEFTKGSGTPKLALKRIESLVIPLPLKEIQERIIDEIEDVVNNEKAAMEQIKALEEKISELIASLINECTEHVPLRKLGVINPSRAELQQVDNSTLVSFVEMASVSEEGYIAEKVDKTLGELLQGGYTYFRDGDIIIAKITPCMENGKCALVAELTNGIGMGSTEFHVIRTDETRLLSKFAFIVLNREEVRLQAKLYMTGKSGHRRVPESFYKDFAFPVFPIEKQNEIIEKVAIIEQKIAELNGSIKNTNNLKDMILKKYL